MKINSENKQAIHDVLITDMQRMIFRQYNELKVRFNVTDEDYDTQQTLLVDNILNCNSINDINELILEYTDLFDSYSDNVKFTLDGTLNYVLSLLVSEIDKLEQAYEFNQIHN
tara:strand:+ start:300 stop:638 length:339 start_codon:yes stop_codon:yes gene_type:complete